METHVQHM